MKVDPQTAVILLDGEPLGYEKFTYVMLHKPAGVLTATEDRRQETVLDLYCGAGTITLALSDHAKKVLGAEIVPEAIDDARENAARNGVKNAEFFCGDASDVAKKLARENLRPDVITVDPPRKGLAADVVESIARCSRDVSCTSRATARPWRAT